MGIIDIIKSFFGVGTKSSITPPPIPPPPYIPEENQQKEKPKKPKDVIEFKIVGTYYRGADACSRRDALNKGEKLHLKKDKRNKYSDTALRVYTDDNVWIGFVDDYHSGRIWNDMESDECDAEFVEFIYGDDSIWFDDDCNMHEKHYDQDDSFIAYYRIPNYEEKHQAIMLKRREDAAIKDLQTPEGRMEPGEVDYQSLTKEELLKMKKSAASKLKGRQKKESAGEIPESGPIKELHDIQVANLSKTLQAIDDALSRFKS